MATEVADITVQKVWEPFPDSKTWRDGKKRGKVVSAEGDNYLVAETMLREFGVGQVCKVEFKTFGDRANPGKEIIKKIWQGEPKQSTAAPQPSPEATRVINAVSTAREDGIAVLALAKCVPSWFSQVDLCDAAAVAQILDSLETAWKMHKARGPKSPVAKQPTNDEMNDSIPY